VKYFHRPREATIHGRTSEDQAPCSYGRVISDGERAINGGKEPWTVNFIHDSLANPRDCTNQAPRRCRCGVRYMTAGQLGGQSKAQPITAILPSDSHQTEPSW
jgi:hypothetical protein